MAAGTGEVIVNVFSAILRLVLVPALALWAAQASAVTFNGGYQVSTTGTAVRFKTPTGLFNFGDIEIGHGAFAEPFTIYADSTNFDELAKPGQVEAVFAFAGETHPGFALVWKGTTGAATDKQSVFGTITSNGTASQNVAGLGIVLLDLLPDMQVRFNAGQGSIMPGPEHGAKLSFLLSLTSDVGKPAPIPLPAGLPLILGGLAALGLLARRRRA